MTLFKHIFALVLLFASMSGNRSDVAVAQSSAPPPVTFNADQDHQDMMDQLGIKALRLGPSGDENASNHANYDESEANPFPNIPDPLIMNDGQQVTTAAMWRDKRRPELMEMFSKYVYGRVPSNVPRVNWTVKTVDHENLGFTPIVAKDVEGVVDNSAYSAISVRMHMWDPLESTCRHASLSIL